MKRAVTGLAVVSVILILLSGCASKEYVPYDYELAKYITPGTYKDVPFEYVDFGVSSDQLQLAINGQLKENGYGKEKTVSTGEVIFGDKVTVSFEGKIDGALDENLKESNITFTVGEGTFLDDFETSLIGQKIGQTCNIEVNFPKDYIKMKYAGKKIQYSVDIVSVVRMSYPELTDEIVSEISNCKSVDEFNEKITEQVEKENLQKADQDKETDIWNAVVSSFEVKEYPTPAIEYLKKTYQKEFDDSAKENDQTLEEFLAENSISEEDFVMYLQKKAETTCKDEMVMYYIARAENIKANDEEISSLAQNYVDTYGYKDVKELYKNYNKKFVEQAVLYQKVKDFVVSSAKQK